MRSTIKTINIARWKKKWMSILTAGRTFILMAIASAVFIIVVGVGGILEQKGQSSPFASMRGITAQLSSSLFSNMLAMEIPTMEGEKSEDAISMKQVSQMLFRLATNVSLNDPRSLVAGELPGAVREVAVPLRLGTGNQVAKGPEDIAPSEQEAGADSDLSHGGAPSDDPTDAVEPVKPDSEPDKEQPGQESADQEGKNKLVFIYHSHNQESWKPELSKPTNNPNDPKINITLVGKRMQQQLEKQGIGAQHSNVDYKSTIKDYNWNRSYQYSNQTVKKAMANNKELEFFFDIHRDSSKRENSTVTINGKDYAKVYFIIGHKNPNWKQNENFAASIHERLEKKYPGISKGIWGKTASTGNGEYNQSLSPNSVIIEIGGIENTLEENYRTADVLAELIAEIVHEKQGTKTVQQTKTKTDNTTSSKEKAKS